MNYAGKFGSGGLAGVDVDLGLASQHGHLSPSGKFHIDKVSTQAPSDAIIISDAHLLFHGDFKRSGVDLILSSGDHEVVLRDYFKGEKRAALASPDGAHLTGDIVNALAGHTQFAQADGSASVAPAIIGHVTKLTGNATAIRNGVSVILNQGDTVHKGDVVQSGSDSTLGITFIDGTVFGLASNARMVLNEMVYDPNGSDNKSLLSLVQGTISFVAGATAKKGDMKVDTPVATMGIRGTAVLVEIDFEVPGSGVAPPAKFQVLVEPDGTTGSYILYDKTTLTQIATVNRAGTQTIINGQGGVSFQSSVQLSPDAQKIISDVFSLKFTDLNNPNTKLTNNLTDTITPETLFLKLASNDTVTVTLQYLSIPEKPAAPPPPPAPEKPPRIPGPPQAAASGGAVTELAELTGNVSINTTSGIVSYADPNLEDRPSVSAQFSSFTYQNAQGTNVTATLTAQQKAAIAAVEVPLVVVQDPNGKHTGTATWTYNAPDGAFDFLAAGEKLTLTYLARVDNNYNEGNETAFVPFTIVVTGTNDKPTLSATGGEITERIGTGNTVIDTVSGTVTFADVDLTDRPVVTAAISTTDPFRYYDAEGNDITATLTQEQLAAILAVEVPLSVVQAAGNTNNGTATWTYSIEDSKFDFIGEGETLTLNYVAQVDDGHGGIVSTPITVTIKGADVVIIGTNDVPTIATTSDAFAEFSNLNQPNPTGSNALHVAAGTITFTDVDLTDRPVASAAFTSFSYLNASSVNITSQLTARQLAAIGAVEVPLTVVQAAGNTNNGSASWSYSAPDGAFDFLADGEILNLAYTATVNDGHGGVVTKPINITVTGSNDTAEITSAAQIASLIETPDTHGSSAPDTANGAITFIDADLSDTHTARIAGVHATGVTSGLANGTVQLSWLALGGLGDSTDGVQGSQSWSFSAPDSSFDYLANGEAVTLTYTVEVADTHGGVTSQEVVVTVTGRNDAPEIAAIAQQALTEQTNTAALTKTIHVTFTDLDLSDTGHTAVITGAVASGVTTGLALNTNALIALLTPGAVSKAAGSSAGAADLSFSAASTAFDYLAKGEVLTLTYTLAINDGDGGVTPKTFVVTVTGTDDAPVINNIAQQNLGEQTDTAPLTATIPVTFTDVDLTDVGHTAAITGVTVSGTTTGLALDAAALMALVTPGAVAKNSGSPYGSVNLSFSAASTAFDYLAKGEILKLTYTVAIDDGDGGKTSKTFVVTITGTNDVPAVAPGDVTGAVTEQVTPAGNLTDTGTIALADVDLTDTHAVSPTITPSAGALGSLTASVTPDTVNGTGGLITWSYSVPDASVEYLAKGETRVEHFTITLDDGHGGTVERTINVTVTGTNDAPVVAAIAQTNLAEQSDTSSLTATIPVTFSDVDLKDIGHTAVITGVAASGDTTGLALNEAALIALITLGGVSKALGSSSGSVNLSFNAASTAFDYLAQDEVLTLTYTVAINDGDGGLTSRTFTVAITGTNDAPVVAEIAQTDLAEQTDTAPLTATIPVTFSDVDLTDVGHTAAITGVATSGETAGLALNEAALIALVTPGAVSKAPGSSSGSIDLSFAAASTAFDYLAQDEVLTLTYTVAIADGDGGTTSKTFTVTITGTNDAPVITSNGGGETTAISVAENSIAVTTVQASDVDGSSIVYSILAGPDSPDHAKFAIDPHTGALSFVDAPNFEYPASAAGSNVYTVQVQAADGAGGYDVQTIVVTVTDAAEPPVAADDAVAATEDAPVTIAAATLLANDTNNSGGALTVASVSATSAKGATVALYGTEIVYNPISGTALQALAAGETTTDTFTYTVDDGHGGTDTATVTVQLTGVNDAPVVQSNLAVKQANLANSHGLLVFDGQFFFGNTELTVSDADHNAKFGIAITGVDNANGYWEYRTSPSGPWIQIELQAGQALLLSADAKVRFNGAGSGDTEQLTFKAWDGTDGSASGTIVSLQETGGSTAFSSGTYAIGAKNVVIDNVQLSTGEEPLSAPTPLSAPVNFVFQNETDPVVQTGTSGKDVLFATSYDDILTGGAGADRFVFAPESNISQDTITDFKPGEDHIDLRKFAELDKDNLGAWLAGHAVSKGTDTLITLATHDTITLKNVALASLQASDFIVSPHH